MADLTITLGNKNYSSWSMRPWLALERTGAPYDEEIIPLDQPETKALLAKRSPSGRVPVLRHGDLVVWDSLSICEYLAETFPAAKLWPAATDARAYARSVSAEMHAGFGALRQNMPMNLRADKKGKGMAPGVAEDIARIKDIWRECRTRYGAGGAFLFGDFTIADAMFAPVVGRFRTYGVMLEGADVAYAEAVWGWPAVKKWVEAARAEKWSHPGYDV